jgi:HEAT repeat protein
MLLRLLSALGPAIVGEVVPMLADERWFVVRNAIILLRTVGDRSVSGEIAGCVDHRDGRVRLEAIKTLFAFEGALSAELLRRAISDPDSKLAEAVVSLAGAHGLADACDPLRELLSRRDLFGRQRALRLRAIKVLATLRDPSLPRHPRLFRGGLFGAAREERLAAFAALACYPVEIREPLVARGMRSRDAELKAICLRLQDSAVSARLEETHA